MAENDDRDLSGATERSQKSRYCPTYENSYAIVIGIDTYKDPKLRPLGKAEEDASSISDVLSAKPYDFQVEMLLGEQATQKAIKRALKKIIDVSKVDDRVIFYFAGHGYIATTIRGIDIGYLACVDTDPDDPFDGLKYDDVIELTHFSRAKHIAFILDACFSGSALGLTRAAVPTAAVQEYLLHTSYQVLTAGAVEVVSDTRSMTGALVKALREGSPGQAGPFTFSHLGQQIHEVIHHQSKGLQSPVYGYLEGSSKGQMVLAIFGAADLLPEGLRLGLTDKDPSIRLYAIADAEKFLTDPEMGDKLRAVLVEMQMNDEDPDVRSRATRALHKKPPLAKGGTSKDIIRQVISICNRRAVYTRMHAQQSHVAMFQSLSECRRDLAKIAMYIEPRKQQQIVQDVIGELDLIERHDFTKKELEKSFDEIYDEINQSKLRIIALLDKLCKSAKVSYTLPSSTVEDVFWSIEEANKPL
jgi:hypothetical protein